MSSFMRLCASCRDCLSQYGGPFQFGAKPPLADAMFGPVCSRVATYNLSLDSECSGVRDHILNWAPIVEWSEAAKV